MTPNILTPNILTLNILTLNILIPNTLARTHVLAAESWNIQYHTFWGNWDYKQECFHPKSPGSRATQNKTCCNNEKRTSSFALYAPDR